MAPVVRVVEIAKMWRCSVCNYEYREAVQGTPFEKLPAHWTCPICGSHKDAFEKVR